MTENITPFAARIGETMPRDGRSEVRLPTAETASPLTASPLTASGLKIRRSSGSAYAPLIQWLLNDLSTFLEKDDATHNERTAAA